jgi:hypothetical protein
MLEITYLVGKFEFIAGKFNNAVGICAKWKRAQIWITELYRSVHSLG